MNLVPRSLLNLYLSTQQLAGTNQESLLVVTKVSAGFQDRGAHLDPEKGLPQCTQVNLSEPAAYNRCVRARSHPGVSVLQLPDAGRLLCGHVLVHRNEGERCKDFQKASSWSRLPKAFSQPQLCVTSPQSTAWKGLQGAGWKASDSSDVSSRLRSDGSRSLPALHKYSLGSTDAQKVQVTITWKGKSSPMG